MELKEFIKTALADITDAVKELQQELQNGAIISPSMPAPIANTTVKDPQNDKIDRLISKIDFDVAITIGSSDKMEGGGKMGIQVFSAKIGGGNEAHTENVSRMTFSIPVVLPTYHVKSQTELKDEHHKQNINRWDKKS